MVASSGSRPRRRRGRPRPGTRRPGAGTRGVSDPQSGQWIASLCGNDSRGGGGHPTPQARNALSAAMPEWKAGTWEQMSSEVRKRFPHTNHSAIKLNSDVRKNHRKGIQKRRPGVAFNAESDRRPLVTPGAGAAAPGRVAWPAPWHPEAEGGRWPRDADRKNPRERSQRTIQWIVQTQQLWAGRGQHDAGVSRSKLIVDHGQHRGGGRRYDARVGAHLSVYLNLNNADCAADKSTQTKGYRAGLS